MSDELTNCPFCERAALKVKVGSKVVYLHQKKGKSRMCTSPKVPDAKVTKVPEKGFL